MEFDSWTFQIFLDCAAEAGANLADRIGGRKLAYEGAIYFLRERRDSDKVGPKS